MEDIIAKFVTYYQWKVIKKTCLVPAMPG